MNIKNVSLVILLISSVFAQGMTHTQLLKEMGKETTEDYKNRKEIEFLRAQITTDLQYYEFENALKKLDKFNDLSRYNNDELGDLTRWKEYIGEQSPKVKTFTPGKYRINQLKKFALGSSLGTLLAVASVYDNEPSRYYDQWKMAAGLSSCWVGLFGWMCGSKFKNAPTIVESRQKNISKFDEAISNRINKLNNKTFEISLKTSQAYRPLTDLANSAKSTHFNTPHKK